MITKIVEVWELYSVGYVGVTHFTIRNASTILWWLAESSLSQWETRAAALKSGVSSSH